MAAECYADDVDGAPGVGLRERNKRERRQRLEDVALQLFERDGFEHTTIEQIAAVAGIAPRTFFSYFASKDDLVLADYDERLGRIVEELTRRPTDEPAWDALRASFAAVASDYQAQAARISRRFELMLATPTVFARSLQLQAGWEQTIAQRLARRDSSGPGDPAPRLLAAAALAVMRSSVQHWLATGRTVALPDLVRDGFDRLGEGLSPRAQRTARRTRRE